jgi:hypothetical protein
MNLVTEKKSGERLIGGVRDLLTAGWLGEQLFAQLGLHRAVSVLRDPGERTRVISAAWKAERPFGATVGGALALTALEGLVSGPRDRKKNRLDRAASALALGACAASVGSALAGQRIAASGHGETPIETGFSPDAETPSGARNAQKMLRVLAPIGMALGVASIGLSLASRALD